MKALLIDDERLARNELRRLLSAFPEIEIAGEAANAIEAREQISALAPDLLFLDVQMPGETGMALLESLEINCGSSLQSCSFMKAASGKASTLVKPMA